MLVKYKTETSVERFKGWIKKDDKIYTNHKAEEIALKENWKPLIIDEQPEYDIETQYLTIYYIDEENNVKQMWKINDIEQDEEEVI